VSERIGWRSVSHFTARFRRRFGMTPSAYRRAADR
jgi:AraC-like DNA-binding protein